MFDARGSTVRSTKVGTILDASNILGNQHVVLKPAQENEHKEPNQSRGFRSRRSTLCTPMTRRNKMLACSGAAAVLLLVSQPGETVTELPAW